MISWVRGRYATVTGLGGDDRVGISKYIYPKAWCVAVERSAYWLIRDRNTGTE